MKLETKSDRLKKMKDSGSDMSIIMLDSMFGDISELPQYNDQDEVYRKACDDIKSMDFSEMADYIDSLVDIADFWQDMATHYSEELINNGAKFDKNGYVI